MIGSGRDPAPATASYSWNPTTAAFILAGFSYGEYSLTIPSTPVPEADPDFQLDLEDLLVIERRRGQPTQLLGEFLRDQGL